MGWRGHNEVWRREVVSYWSTLLKVSSGSVGGNAVGLLNVAPVVYSGQFRCWRKINSGRCSPVQSLGNKADSSFPLNQATGAHEGGYIPAAGGRKCRVYASRRP